MSRSFDRCHISDTWSWEHGAAHVNMGNWWITLCSQARPTWHNRWFLTALLETVWKRAAGKNNKLGRWVDEPSVNHSCQSQQWGGRETDFPWEITFSILLKTEPHLHLTFLSGVISVVNPKTRLQRRVAPPSQDASGFPPVRNPTALHAEDESHVQALWVLQEKQVLLKMDQVQCELTSPNLASQVLVTQSRTRNLQHLLPRDSHEVRVSPFRDKLKVWPHAGPRQSGLARTITSLCWSIGRFSQERVCDRRPQLESHPPRLSCIFTECWLSAADDITGSGY